eukprot:symbB.v1.2.028288.t1/scaffold2987.1/size129848/10
MAGLLFRKTFLDVVIVNEEVKKRSKSAPAAMKQKPYLQASRSRSQEKYVANLEKRSELLKSNPDAEKVHITHSSMPTSKGSVGHPEVCRRPCIQFLRGHCDRGALCGYCHLTHDRRPATLDQSQRRFIQRLPEVHFLKMLLPHVRSKVEASTLEGAAGILELLEREIALRDSRVVAKRIPRQMNYVLQHMNLASLVSLGSRLEGNFPKVWSQELKYLRQVARASIVN